MTPRDLETGMAESDDEFARRELCADGSCIGLLDGEGRCKECGTPGTSSSLDPRSRGLRDEAEVADELEAHIAETDLAAPPEGFQDRQLCPDGACIGVIGPDGRCGECGTAAPSA